MDEVYEEDNGNLIIGKYPELQNSTITFEGKNNVLYCEENVVLSDSELIFKGNNALIFLSSSRYKYKLSVKIYNDSVFHVGKNNYINQKMTAIISEQKHCFIGDDGMISINVLIRNADAHLIYSSVTGKRINATKSIYIGDHVWIGQDVRILKGTQIDSGSIIGVMSVVSGKKIPHNSAWAGNPCREIHKDIFWDRALVHHWDEERIEKSMNYSEYISEYKRDCHPDYWHYEFEQNQSVDWCSLEKIFSKKIPCIEKCEFLKQFSHNKEKNRFVHNLM